MFMNHVREPIFLLKENQATTLETLQVKKLNLKTARAYHIRLNFQEFWNQPLQEVETFLKKWYFWATHSPWNPSKRLHTP